MCGNYCAAGNEVTPGKRRRHVHQMLQNWGVKPTAVQESLTNHLREQRRREPWSPQLLVVLGLVPVLDCDLPGQDGD